MSSTEKDSSRSHVRRRYSRCPVVPEESRATLQVGRKRFSAVLIDKSIEGFSIRLKPSAASRAKLGEVWILQTCCEKSQVVVQWMDKQADGDVQFGLQRLENLYRSNASGMFPVWLGKRRRTVHPDLLLAAVVMIAIAILALPGIGDRLGTAKRIQAGFLMLRDSVSPPSTTANASR